MFVRQVAAATLFTAAVAVSAGPARAQSLSLVGTANVSSQPGSPDNLLIDFLLGTPEPTIARTPTGTLIATAVSGPPFSASITPGTAGTVQDLVASTGGFVGLPVGSFLTIGGFTFTLQSAPAGGTFGPLTFAASGAGTTATFGVVGAVTGGAFGATPVAYSGTFRGDIAGAPPDVVVNAFRSGGTIPIVFAAEFTVAASVVPEPATYALLAPALGVLALSARRRRRA